MTTTHVPAFCSVRDCKDEAWHWTELKPGDTFYLCETHWTQVAPEEEYYFINPDTREVEKRELAAYACADDCEECWN